MRIRKLVPAVLVLGAGLFLAGACTPATHAGHAVSSAVSSVTEPSEPPISAASHATHPAPRATTPHHTAVPTHTAPALTAAQQQAIAAASSYLQLGSGFSRAGLIDQLSSQYGDGFSVTDATYAVDHVTVDWNQQAVEAAKSYLQLGSGFSRASLIDQLTSAYGDKFTTAQAEYAADHVGL